MSSHRLFYYPYAGFTSEQLPLLKIAALYFDQLSLLDPVDASWESIGADHVARGAMESLRSAGLVQVITPATVLSAYEADLSNAIRRDMDDPAFLALCNAHETASSRTRWTLALAKVPTDLQTDAKLRHLLGDFARTTLAKMATDRSDDQPAPHFDATDIATGIEYNQQFNRHPPPALPLPMYNEMREGYGGTGVEYRYIDVPLALGEAIMLNHALFAGLLTAGAMPITDDAFHSRVLAHKLQRAVQEPAIRQLLADKAADRRIKSGSFAVAALNDPEIRLPILNPAIPLSDVLEYRHQNADALGEVRHTMAILARRLRSELWSADFVAEIEHQALPDLMVLLQQAERSRDAWLSKERTQHWLQIAGIGVGAASAVLALVTAPITSIAMVAAGLSLASGSILPSAELLMAGPADKPALPQNGLHYLLKI